MSFSADIRRELTASTPERSCCRAALLYGLLECGRGFSDYEILLQTESPEVAALVESLLRELTDVTPVREEGRFVLLSVPAAQRKRVLARFGHAAGELAVRLNRANFECEECAAAYLRGMFLACGAVSHPQTDYHLEFNIPTLPLSRDIAALLGEWELPPKRIRRKGDNVLYYKDSEHIEDCLTRMGASAAALELMSVKVIKDIRNNINRVNNCETANIDKTVAAAAVHREDVEVIERHGGLELLPPELQTLAQLRWDHPEMSLRELGEALDPPLTRSGVNHRLARLHALADEYRRAETATPSSNGDA